MKKNESVEYSLISAILKSLQKDNLLTTRELENILISYKKRYLIDSGLV